MKRKVDEELILATDRLVQWLNVCRPMFAPYRMADTKRYFKIEGKQRIFGHVFWGAYCFVSKKDFELKTLGKVLRGDLLAPSKSGYPEKHARGYLFDRSTWEDAFEETGMTDSAMFLKPSAVRGEPWVT